MRAPDGSYRLSLAVGGSEGEGRGLPVLGVRVWTGIRVLDLERRHVARLDAILPAWRSVYTWAPTTSGVHLYVEEWGRNGSTTPPQVAAAGHDLSYASRAYSRGWWHERVRPARIRIPPSSSPGWVERMQQHADAMERAMRLLAGPP